MSTFTETLLKPRPKSARERKLWAIGLHTQWRPFATLMRATGQLTEEEMPNDVLGAPEVFKGISKDGRIVLKVQPQYRELEGRVRGNFIEKFDSELAQGIAEHQAAYDKTMAVSAKAAKPVLEKSAADAEAALLSFKAEQARKVQEEAERVAAAESRRQNRKGRSRKAAGAPTPIRREVPAAA